MAATYHVPPLLILICLFVLLLQTNALTTKYVADGHFITKDGTRVKLSLIRRYLKYATDEELSHMVFQLDAITTKLTSYHRTIDIPTNGQGNRIKHEQFPSNAVRQTPRPLFYRDTSNGTFFHTKRAGKETLVAVLGDTFDMHRLNSEDHPDIYINHFQTPENPEEDTDLRSSKIGKKGSQCREDYILEFDVRFDKELCTRYGHSFHITQKVIQILMQKSSNEIYDMTCVRISALDIFGTCSGNTDHGDFNWNSLPVVDCSSSSQNSSGCGTISDDIMDIVQNDFNVLKLKGQPRHVPNEYRDMRLVFSGLQGTGSLAGIAYRAQACSSYHGYSWISGINRVTLYHEIGHMLGANHDEAGIMRANLPIGEGLHFSANSTSEMVRFVTADPRSWCLRRKLGTLKQIIEEDGWGPAFSLAEVSQDGKPITAMGMTLASISRKAKRDLILQYHTRRDDGPRRLFLRVFPNVLTPRGNFVLKPTTTQPIDINPELKSNTTAAGFRISAGHIANKNSKDLVLLYVAHKTFKSGIKSHVPYYHVGFDMSTTNGPARWTPALRIEGLKMQPALGKMSRRDVWLGHVRTTEATDLVYAQLEESDTGSGVATYMIGFSVSPTTGKPTEWSEQYRIPGEFSKYTRSFSISIVDIDNNGKPDLVIYVQGVGIIPDQSPRAKYAFIRVGKDLDETGRVTKGWTRFKRVPDANEMGMGAIDISPSIKHDTPPALVSLTRVAGKHTLSLMAGRNVLTSKLMDTGRSESSIDVLTDGCNRCYDSSDAPLCIKDVEHCRAEKDELNIQSRITSLEGKTKISLRTTASDYNKSLFHEEIYGISNDSMFCLGFEELRKKNEGCDVVDAMRVLAKGLEIAVIDTVTNNQISPDDIETESIFEDPGSTHGSTGLPILTQITISRNSASNKKDAIRMALNKMRNQYPSFQRFFNQNKVIRQEGGEWGKKVWTITYRSNLTTEDIDNIF